MDRQQIGMKLAIEALGVQLRLTRFRDRLVLQKAVYLAQAAGVNLGYRFRWYLRGPYSPALARDAFAAATEIREFGDESQGWTLDSTSVQNLKRIRPVVPAREAGNADRQLELLASVHYLITREGLSRDNLTELRKTLKSLGKDFSKSRIQHAVDELGAHGLLPPPSTKKHRR